MDHHTLEIRQVNWRRLDYPGQETLRLARRGDGSSQMSGVAAFNHGGTPTFIMYEVTCDANWRTQRAQVHGRRGDQPFDLLLTVDASGDWTLNDVPVPALGGCVDVDLAFSPSTNTLPIRRLALPVGAEAHVRAAWVRFPELTVEVLDQVYRRTAEHRYTYESDNGAFRADLIVDDFGLVMSYPNLWISERAAR